MIKTSFEFQILKISRKNYLNLLAPFSTEQLNKIPKGFNNNLIWNLGHVIVTQQILCYKLSGNNMNVSESMVDKYRKGSKPEEFIKEGEIQELKQLAIDLVPKFEEDFSTGLFTNYQPYPTSYGIQLESIEDAIAFNNVHEGIHMGSVFALRKLV